MRLINIHLTDVLVHSNLSLSSYRVYFSFIPSTFNGNYSDIVWHSIMGYQTSVTIDNSNFTDNQNAQLSLLAIGFWTNIQSKVIYYRVQFNNNHGGICLVSILAIKGDIEISIIMTNFTYNQYSACALYISHADGNNSKTFLKKCEFVNNQSPAQGAVLYFRVKNYRIAGNFRKKKFSEIKL